MKCRAGRSEGGRPWRVIGGPRSLASLGMTVLLVACGGDSVAPASNATAVAMTFTNLRSLDGATEGSYQAWIVDRGAGVLPPSDADAPALDVALGRCGEVFAGAGVVAGGSLAVGAERGGAFAYTGSEASTLTKTTAAAKRRQGRQNA